MARSKPGTGRPADATSLEHLLPKRLSPSRAADFQQCPKQFYYKTLLGLSTPATFATCKGTLAHHAFETVFDLPRAERTAERAVVYVREHWSTITNEPAYVPLHDAGADAVEAMLCEAEELVRKWFLVERPQQFDPAERELYLKASLAGIEVHGYIDRLDKIVDADGGTRWIISDYKTGKPAREPYLEKAFFAMNVYAYLARQQLGITVAKLRLIYVQNGKREDVVSQTVTDASIARTEQQLERIWRSITTHASRGEFPPRKQVLCQWCHFQSECPAWAPELASIPMLNRDGEPYPR
jgi:putative RecB family exonuclease